MKQNKIFFIIGITLAIAGCAFINIGPPWFQKYAADIPAGDISGTDTWVNISDGLPDDGSLGVFDISVDSRQQDKPLIAVKITLFNKIYFFEYRKTNENLKWYQVSSDFQSGIDATNVTDMAMVEAGGTNFVVFVTNDTDVLSWVSTNNAVTSYIDYSESGIYFDMDVDTTGKPILVYYYNQTATHDIRILSHTNNWNNDNGFTSAWLYNSPSDLCVDGGGNMIQAGYITNSIFVIAELGVATWNAVTFTFPVTITAMDIVANGEKTFVAYNNNSKYIDFLTITNGAPCGSTDSIANNENNFNKVVMEHWDAGSGTEYLYIAYHSPLGMTVKRVKSYSGGTQRDVTTVGNGDFCSVNTDFKMVVIPAADNKSCDIYVAAMDNGKLEVWKYRDTGE